MKIAFIIIVLLHGLIHLMGFVKAFGISDIKELKLPISKSIGTIWLLTAIVFIVYGFLFLIDIKLSWLFGFIAVALSQISIIKYWKDAKFGTIPNVIILVVSIVSLGSFLLKAEFTSNVKQDFTSNNSYPTDLVTEKDIEHLPVAVQEYLRYTQSVGKAKIKNFRAEFVGELRSATDDEYMKVASVQYNFYQNPSRFFYIEAKKMGLPATALHLYKNASSTFQVKLLNWLKVVDAKGEKMNQGETVTLFNDMCVIAPATLIDKSIKWESINDTVVKAIYTNGDIKINAKLYFNQKHELVNFISPDRYDTDGKTYKNYPWSTPLENYQLMNGYILPSKGELIYHKPDGDFKYGELVYKSVQYNLEEIESNDKK